jgi:predicted nucleic acid-binding Zn ribbon protein
MDDADMSDDRIEIERNDGIRRASIAKSLKPIGACYYCDETVGSGRLFCDSGCREDYELEQAQRKRNGQTNV